MLSFWAAGTQGRVSGAFGVDSAQDGVEREVRDPALEPFVRGLEVGARGHERVSGLHA